MSHTTFNLIGVLWMLPLMGVFLSGIDAIVPGDPWNGAGAEGEAGLAYAAAITAHLAAFHTAFNILNTSMLLPFVPQLARFVNWIIPVQEKEVSNQHLKFLESGLVGTPELAGYEARRGLQQMLGVCSEMTDKLADVLSKPTDKLGELVDEIKLLEGRTDDMEEEIVMFCGHLAKSATSEKVGHDVAIYLEMANDIERMGDFCFNLVKLAERRYQKGYEFDEEAQKRILEMIEVVREFIDKVHGGLEPGSPSTIADAKLLESKIDSLRDKARKHEARKMQAGKVKVREGLIFLDMMTNMEKLGDYCYNISASTQKLDEPATT